MRISDWSSDVCSSDLLAALERFGVNLDRARCKPGFGPRRRNPTRSLSQRKEAKAPTPLFAVNGAVQLRSAVSAALPAITEIAEIVFGALGRDAASVVDHPDTGKAAKIVSIADPSNPLPVGLNRKESVKGK